MAVIRYLSATYNSYVSSESVLTVFCPHSGSYLPASSLTLSFVTGCQCEFTLLSAAYSAFLHTSLSFVLGHS